MRRPSTDTRTFLSLARKLHHQTPYYFMLFTDSLLFLLSIKTGIPGDGCNYTKDDGSTPRARCPKEEKCVPVSEGLGDDEFAGLLSRHKTRFWLWLFSFLSRPN